MSTEKTYTDIEHFLNQTLSDTERVEFQERMASDEAFAQEVALHRKLHQVMEDPNKIALRHSLEGLSQEFIDTPPAPKVVPMRSKNNWKLIWPAAASILLFGFALWFFLKKPPVENEIVKEPTQAPKEEIVPDKTPEVTPEKVIPPQEKEEAVVQKEPTAKAQPKVKETPKPKPVPIDYYLKNKELMATIEKVDPQATHQFTMILPEKEEVITPRNGQVNLIFQGQLKSYDFSETDEFTVAVFNNQEKTFREQKPLFKASLPLEKIVQDDEIMAQSGGSLEEFNFSFAKNLPMSLGRYYYVIQSSSNSEILAGGTFIVK